MEQSFWQYLAQNSDLLLERTIEHLWLTAVSIFFAVVVGLSTGIALTRMRKLASPILGVASVVQTIPSIALLGFMIPLAGIGAMPAIIALFLYALLPIIRNTYTGIDEVDPAIREAGVGMGMTNWQVLTKVDLPLALPTIFAGIRTATVINVGVATLAALIAAGGLGEFIFQGIALNNTNMVIAGALPSALLAIILDQVLALLQKRIRQLVRPLLIVVLLALLAMGIYSAVKSITAPKFTAGFDYEFREREDGWPGLKQTYNMDMATKMIDAGLMYRAVKEGEVDVISGFATDGRIKAFDLLVLEDNKDYFPPYYAAPLVREETLEEYPNLKLILDTLAYSLNDEVMRRLNYRVDELKETPREVAASFLDSLGFRTDMNRNGEGDIIIGSKNFTEQYILAEMYGLLTENYTTLDADVKSGLGGTKICFDALRTGELDMYVEYTGTAFLVILNTDEQTRQTLIRDKDAVYQHVKAGLKEEYNLKLLSPLGFNNTYAMMMRRQQARELGITTISDLAEQTR